MGVCVSCEQLKTSEFLFLSVAYKDIHLFP